ncbi:hypothetical protein FOXYSP1_04154 [Fusarium oxysporum f. sp. phaseoli]
MRARNVSHYTIPDDIACCAPSFSTLCQHPHGQNQHERREPGAKLQFELRLLERMAKVNNLSIPSLSMTIKLKSYNRPSHTPRFILSDVTS